MKNRLNFFVWNLALRHSSSTGDRNLDKNHHLLKQLCQAGESVNVEGHRIDRYLPSVQKAIWSQWRETILICRKIHAQLLGALEEGVHLAVVLISFGCCTTTVSSLNQDIFHFFHNRTRERCGGRSSSRVQEADARRTGWELWLPVRDCFWDSRHSFFQCVDSSLGVRVRTWTHTHAHTFPLFLC